MKKVLTKYTETSLILRIVIGLVIGVILALIIPGNEWIALLGSLFVSALKALAPILVFFLVLSALSNAKTKGSMKSIIVLYIISTLVAAFVAVAISVLMPSVIDLNLAAEDVSSAPQGVGEVISTLLLNCVANPVTALSEANYLGILTWAVLLGFALRRVNEGTRSMLEGVSKGVTTVVRWVINVAPFGILGLVYDSVGSNGLDIFYNYGHIIVVLVICFLIIALITNPLIVLATTHKNPYPLVFRCLKDSAVTAFFTRSSAANIPVNMELCKNLELNEDNYSVSIPLGATVNMAGAAITITVMTLAAANTLGVHVDIGTAVILSVIAAVSACGTSGVAGGSLMLIPLACSLFGISAEISAQVVAIGFIIGVIQDSCETALNSSSDVLFTAAAEWRAKRKAGEEFGLPKDTMAEVD